MEYKPVIVMLSIIGALGAGTYFWLSQPIAPVTPTHVAVVLDCSDSVEADEKCETLRGILLRAMDGHRLSKSTKFYISFTGNPSTAMEPMQLGTFEIPFSNRVMEGGEANKRARSELLAGVVDACKKDRALTRSSPIFLSVKRAVEQLKAAGCDVNARCSLYIRTDGEETEESWLRESLRAGKALKKGLPAPLDNEGIKVAFCGLSETRGVVIEKSRNRRLTGKRNAQTAELMTSLWRKVFVDPDAVVFEPFCPRGVRVAVQKKGQ